MKNNVHRMLSLGMLPLLLLSAGCGDTPSEKSPDSGTTTTAAAETGIYANVPTADYKGQTFNILNSYFSWAMYQMDAESMNGEVYNDAVYKRNAAVEERLNIKLKIDEADDNAATFEKLENLILAGDDVYDAAYLTTLFASAKAADNYYLNLYDIDSLHLDEPWWNQRSMAQYEINGKLYWAHGDASINYYDCLWTLYFNRTLIDDLQLEDPYKLVIDGKWTLDKFNEMMSAAVQDINADGKYDENDRWGMTCINGASLALLHSAGESAIELVNGTPAISAPDEKLLSTYEKIQKIFAVDYVRIKNDDLKESLFLNGKSLFYGETLGHAADLREMITDFGIIPYPKYDVKQESYGSYMSPSAMAVYIPTTVKDPDRSGTVIECLNALSYETVLPAYYDLVLGEKHLRDEYSQEVVDIMFQSAECELAYVYRWNNYQQTVMDMLVFNHSISSTLEAARPATEAVIAEFMEKIK